MLLFFLEVIKAPDGNSYIEDSPLSFSYNCADTTSCSPQSLTVERGLWRLDVWGASGGNGRRNYNDADYPGGKGGYSVGVFRFTQSTKLFLFIGGEGQSRVDNDNNQGGYNGGGKGNDEFYGAPGSGGGSTDIRVENTERSSRIIVAGGGGGAGVPSNGKKTTCFGGAGGGIVGLNGGGYDSELTEESGRGGTQTGGGAGGRSNGESASSGSILQGGNAVTSGSTSSSGGGGGGYYGGGGGAAGGGGGGSGFISSKYLCQDFYSNTLNGKLAFPSPKGANETGHLGNGFIKISRIYPRTPIPKHQIPGKNPYYVKMI